MKVTAAFVTMNRSATASTCIERLLVQSRPPDEIIVVDNHSADDTLAVIGKLGSRHPGLIRVIPLAENLGNAGGMEIALDAAFGAGADFVWILDDDSWPEPDALRHLLEIESPDPCVRASKVVDLATGNLSWPLQIQVPGGWKTLEKDSPFPAEDRIRIRRSWLAALLPREIFRKIGPVNGSLFLRGEDEDYPRRIEDEGYPVYLATRSIVHHPASGKLLRLEVFGREFVMESALKPDNLYYRLRNIWWLTKRRKGVPAMTVMAILHFIVLRKDGAAADHWEKIWFEALRDASRNRLGIRGPSPGQFPL